MQNRGNLTPSPTGLYSSSSLRLDASRAANVRERERRGRRRMRYLPQHPPFWPFFTKWMEKLVPRKHGLACKGTGPSNEREKNAFGGGKGSGSSIVCPRPIRQLADPFRPLPSPPLISSVVGRGANGSKNERGSGWRNLKHACRIYPPRMATRSFYSAYSTMDEIIGGENPNKMIFGSRRRNREGGSIDIRGDSFFQSHLIYRHAPSNLLLSQNAERKGKRCLLPRGEFLFSAGIKHFNA